jgi:ABC-type multidrug transport system fused ATPase/permease subunit
MKKLKNINSIANLFSVVWKNAPSKKLVVFFIVLSTLAQVTSLMEPIVIGRIFNSIQFDSSDPEILKMLLRSFGLIALIEIGFWVFHGPARVLERKNAFLTRKNFKEKMVAKVVELPVSWHKKHHSGDTIDKIDKASSKLFDFAEDIFQLVGVAVRLVGSVVILTIFDWRIILITVAVAIFAIAVVVYFDRILIKGYKKIFKAENFLAAGIYDYVSNIITVITLRLKKRAMKDIEGRLMKAYPTYKKTVYLDQFKWFLVSMSIMAMTLAVLMLSAFESYRKEGVIVIGTLFILYRYLSQIGSTFYTFAWKYSQTVEQNEAVMAVETIQKEQASVVETKERGLPENWRSIRISDLNFDYYGENSWEFEKTNFQGGSIKKVSLCFERGQKIALVGESGSGKSTLLSLIRGLHHTDKAKVYCDGKLLENGLRHLNSGSLLIPQEPEIFNATARYNITMGDELNEEKLQSAMKIAGFENVVKKLKKGLATNVMEKGVSLSGGEKQRLALARGIYAAQGHDFLLFDEPTSSVDSGNELKIYRNVFENFPDKTIFSAIHRLHLLRYFDYIYFFKDGRIIAEGTFNTLLNDKGFSKLWEMYNKKEDQ